MSDSRLVWRLRDRSLSPGRPPLVMGIVNVTPDSSSDRGRFAAGDGGVARGPELARQGADLLDIGGESTPPGAAPVPLEVEVRRVLPVVPQLAPQTVLPL